MRILIETTPKRMGKTMFSLRMCRVDTFKVVREVTNIIHRTTPISGHVLYFSLTEHQDHNSAIRRAYARTVNSV